MMTAFLLKGVLRDKSRSFFPILTVSAGVFLTVFFYCFMQGVFNDMIKVTAQFDSGHVKVMTRAYHELSDQVPNDLAILETSKLMQELKEQSPDMLWTPRIRFGGLLDIPDENGETREQGPVMGLGIDLISPDSPEKQVLELEQSVVKGTMPLKKDEILISRQFAEKLGVDVGDTATLMGSTMYGSMAVYNFKVTGLIEFGMLALDRSTIVADIEGVRDALDMADGAGEIYGYSKDMLYKKKGMPKLAVAFNSVYSDENDEFSYAMISMNDGSIGDYLALIDYFGVVIIVVFMFAMSLVLWNSGLLNSLRRYGEIGVRLAMGEPKATIYWRMIIESVLIGIIGTIIGTAIGLAISYYMQHVGINFSEMMQGSTVLLTNELRAMITPTSYIIGFFPGVLASVIGTMFAGIGIFRRQTANLFKELEV